ncbi:MAG TPA: AraC family transcriptional regulator [Lactobacillus sp.]|nr:AraC family transcriptional regulator [Lactobacillus sp.]
MNFLQHAKRLPVIDWNLTFFGAHEQTVDDGWVVPVEKHYAFECIYVLEGTEFVEIHDEHYELKSGDFFIIPPEFSHRVWAGKDLTYFCFHFDIDNPELKIRLIQGLQYCYRVDSPLCRLLAPHLQCLDDLIDPDGYDFDTQMTIQIELSQMLQAFYETSKAAVISGSTEIAEYSRLIADYLKTELTRQVLEFVKEGQTSGVGTVEISAAIRKIGFSDGYGFRMFKETYGISPRKYLSKLKINEAKKLLTKPQYSVTDVGEALGYNNSANFSRQFKRWTGSTPNEYRKSQMGSLIS